MVDAKVAHDAYYENVRQKENTVKKRITILTTALANLETKAGQAQKSYTAAVIANDTSEMDSLQTALAELANQKLSTSAQIEALHQVNVKGESNLYEDAVAKANAAFTLGSAYYKRIQTINKSSREVIELWEKIKRETNYAPDLSRRLDTKYASLKAHFHRPDISIPITEAPSEKKEPTKITQVAAPPKDWR